MCVAYRFYTDIMDFMRKTAGGHMYTLTVTELANRSGATPHTVRYYTRMGLLRPERNPDNGYREKGIDLIYGALIERSGI